MAWTFRKFSPLDAESQQSLGGTLVDTFTNTVEQHRYVIYDFESDFHTLTHHPNHVEADVLQVDKNNNTSEDCLTNTLRQR